MAKRKRQRSGEDISLHRMDNDAVVSLGCESCELLTICGGNTRVGGGMCETRCSGCGPDCDLVCLGKPDVLARAVIEVGGFGFEDIGSLSCPEATLPRYVPMIHNGSNRTRPLRTEWAAVPLSVLLQHPQGVPTPVATSPAGLRAWFKLAPETKLVLMGIGLDDEIERYWGDRSEGLFDLLAGLGFSAAVVPNYSFSLRHPRPQHLYNRKRSLVCAREWSTRGIPTIPYLQAVTPRDWEYWREFLEVHPEVSVIAKEFQTGLANPKRGLIALNELARLQDALKRPLHLLARGGVQFRGEFSRLFDSWTLTDSTPFMRAVNWHKARMISQTPKWDKAPNRRVDALLKHNIALWQRMVLSPYTLAERSPRIPKEARASQGQLSLPSFG
jgi:hypothetical protein